MHLTGTDEVFQSYPQFIHQLSSPHIHPFSRGTKIEKEGKKKDANRKIEEKKHTKTTKTTRRRKRRKRTRRERNDMTKWITKKRKEEKKRNKV